MAILKIPFFLVSAAGLLRQPNTGFMTPKSPKGLCEAPSKLNARKPRICLRPWSRQEALLIFGMFLQLLLMANSYLFFLGGGFRVFYLFCIYFKYLNIMYICYRQSLPSVFLLDLYNYSFNGHIYSSSKNIHMFVISLALLLFI